MSIPHSESHYSREHSSLKYFDHAELTFNKLYKLFVEYYISKTGNPIAPIKESTYIKYFNHNLNFTFTKPRTDVCNFCFKYRHNTKHNIELENHKKSVNEYKILKKQYAGRKECFVP